MLRLVIVYMDLKVGEEMMFNCHSEGYKYSLKVGLLANKCANYLDYSQAIISIQVQSVIHI